MQLDLLAMQMFIDGGWRPAVSGKSFDVRDPATGGLVGTVPAGEAGDADAAIRSAAAAFELWRQTPVAERARILHAAAYLLRTRANEFAHTLTRELGRPLAGSKQEMLRTADLFDFQAEEGKLTPLTTLMLAALFHEAGARHAISLANDTPYGLAGFVFSGSLATGLAVAERLDAGSIWVNDIQRSHHNAPFGGMKMSGIGREKGREGIEAYLETKTIYLSYDEALA